MKEIEFNGEQTDPKLVINSIVEPGQPVNAAISKSYFFLDNDASTLAPDDLVAMLYVNGNCIGPMTRHIDTVSNFWVEYDDVGYPYYVHQLITVFNSDYRPAEGDIVKITASANGFDDVEAVTSPLPVGLTCAIKDSRIFDYYADYTVDTVGDSTLYASYQLELTIEITDPRPGQADYFRLCIDNGSRYDDYNNYVSYYADYNDPVFGSLVAENDFFDISDLNMAPKGVFSDVLFDGRSYQIKVPFSLSLTKSNDLNPDLFRISITMEHLSREYYYYLYTCDQGDEVTALYAEPIQTYTNVNGGYGIVGGRAADSLWFVLPLDER